MSALRRLREDDVREIHFRPWVYEVAKNKCIDAYRRARNTSEVSFDAHDQVGTAEHDRLAEPAATPDTAVEAKVAFDNLRGAFGGLSPAHHDILVMREFEGLSYQEIGERLGMSRGAVESTLVRARKRLGEEYEELVSGKRCLRVQRVVEDTGIRAAGLRDQRRVARHLAHCQPCRRHAHLAGADIADLVRPASAPARVAAFLPLPAFLRRRSGGGDDVAEILSHQAARPAAQWTAHMAGSVDPGTVSGWAKVAAAAATVAIAGGSAIEHRAPAAPAAPAPAAAAAAEHERAPAARRTTGGSPSAATAAHAGPSAAAAAPAVEGDRSTAARTSRPGARRAAGADGPNAGTGVGGLDPRRTPAGMPQAPLESGAGTARETLAPVIDPAGAADGGGVAPVSSSDGEDARPAGSGERLGSVVAPVEGVADARGRGVPAREPAGGASDALEPGGSGRTGDVVESVRGALEDLGLAAANAAPTGDRGSVRPRVSDALPNLTAAPKSLVG